MTRWPATSAPAASEARIRSLISTTSLTRDVLQQHRELVPAETGDGVDVAGVGHQPPRDLDQHGVTRGVAEPVVDRLEAVEVDEEQRNPHAAPAGPVQGLRDPVEQDAAVGQVGQGVVPRVVDHLVGQLEAGERLRADHGERVEGVLVGADRRPGAVPRRWRRPRARPCPGVPAHRSRAPPAASCARPRRAAGSAAGRRPAAPSITSSGSCRAWTRTAASKSTLSRRAFSRPCTIARVLMSNVASGTTRRTSVHHGLLRSTTAPR